MTPEDKRLSPLELKQLVKDLSSVPSTKGSAASHTYDNYRDRWDRFDVDKALRQIDDNNSQKSPQDDSRRPSSSSSLFSFPPQRTGENRLEEQWRQKGNAYFKNRQWESAYECYSKSIECAPTTAAYANRALVALKLGDTLAAEADCNEALKQDDKYVKAYLRRGTARKEQGKYVDAIDDFEWALRLEPNNKEAATARKECIALWERGNTSHPKCGINAQQRVHFALKSDAAAAASECTMRARVTRQSKDAGVGSDGVERAFQCRAAVTEADEGSSDNFPPLQDTSESKPSVLVNAWEMENRECVSMSTMRTEKSELKSSGAQQVDAVMERTTGEGAVGRIDGSDVVQRFQRPIPKTGVDFERAWRGLQNDEAAQCRYLMEKVEPGRVPSLLKQALTPALLYAITKVVLQHVVISDAQCGVDLLDALTKVPRFDMNALLLTKAQRHDLAELWGEVEGTMKEASTDASNSLRIKFKL